MNPKSSSGVSPFRIWLAALLLSAVAASAQTTITFSIDMTNNPVPPGQVVAARGTFDGWGTPGFVLTNNSTGDTNIWSGTVVDTDDAFGKGMDWQYVVATNGTILQYSSQADGDNYNIPIPTNGGTVVLPLQYWDDDGSPTNYAITFQVDMAEQLHLGKFDPTSDTVYAQGYFEGWNDNFPLTNNTALNTTNNGIVSSMPYVGTYTNWIASPGAAGEYKFVLNSLYEAPTSGDPDNNENRGLLNAPQVLPLVSFSDVAFADSVTNNVTFIIDMSVQEAVGAFNPSSNTVEIHGDYNNWGSGTTMTNSPTDPDTNHYYFNYTYVGPQNSDVYFKYVIQPGTQWENVSAANAINGNRYQVLVQGNSTNGPVYFSDEGPASLADFITVSNCMVTFTVDMTLAINSNVFTPGVDTVWLNGINGGIDNSYYQWSELAAPPQYQMNEIGDGPLYNLTVPVNEGQPIDLTYKYGIDAQDDEAGSGDNHSRYVRSLPNYAMPTDLFGSQGNTTSTELSWGNFTVTHTNNNIAFSWLGRDGVRLETATNLTPPVVWTQLPMTDGSNLTVTEGPGTMPPVGYVSTNYPIGTTNMFFRLVGPQ